MKKLLALLIVAGLASVSLAVSYQEVVPWSTIDNGNLAGSNFGIAVDGQTGYFQLTQGDGAAIVKVENLNGVQTATTLVTTLPWALASGGSTSMSGWYGFDVYGSSLIWGDSGTDSVWKVDTSTGALTEYVSAATIMGITGATSSQVLSTKCVSPVTGEYYFYEGQSDSLFKTTGTNSIQMVLSASQLTNLISDSSPSGGLTIDASGNIYLCDSSSDGIYVWDEGAESGSTVLSQAQIIAVTGETSAGFGDIFYAPDGQVYFYEMTSDGIMAFDPANPASSLYTVIGEADLLAGPAGSDSVIQLSWYDGNIAWHQFGQNGMYAIPEPTTMLLLGLSGFAALRRRMA